MASKRQSASRSGHSGRVTAPKSARSTSSRSSSSRSSSAGPGGRSGAAKERAAKPERQPDLNPRAVDRLVERVGEALPRGRVRAAFSGTKGMSPNAVTVAGARPGALLVGVAAATRRPWLMVVAVVAMAVVIVVIMRFGNSTRVVGELPDELVVFASRSGRLEPTHRGPIDVQVLPYRDPRWLKVAVGGDVLFVSKRTYGAVVAHLAPTPDEGAEADDVGPGGADDGS